MTTESKAQYKKIQSTVNPIAKLLTYYYWVEENPPEDQEPDHVVTITLEDYIKMYNFGARGICPECLADGVVSWLYEQKHFNGISDLPTAIIYSCKKCPTHFNGLYYYKQ